MKILKWTTALFVVLVISHEPQPVLEVVAPVVDVAPPTIGVAPLVVVVALLVVDVLAQPLLAVLARLVQSSWLPFWPAVSLLSTHQSR